MWVKQFNSKWLQNLKWVSNPFCIISYFQLIHSSFFYSYVLTARTNVDGDGRALAPAAAAAAGNLSGHLYLRDGFKPPLNSTRDSGGPSTLDGQAAPGRALRQVGPLIRPEMLDRILMPGPNLEQNVRYVKTEMERLTDRLTIERRKADEAEMVRYKQLDTYNFLCEFAFYIKSTSHNLMLILSFSYSLLILCKL